VVRWVNNQTLIVGPRQDHRCVHLVFKGTSIKSVANSYSCKWFNKEAYGWRYDCIIRLSKGKLKNKQFGVIKFKYPIVLARKEIFLVLTHCAIALRKIGWSSYWKWMTNVGVIKTQHPKKAMVANWTTKKRPNPFEETCKMT
jgi:hypothetical protein